MVDCVTLVVVWLFVVCCLLLRAACCSLVVWLFVDRCCVIWSVCLLLFIDVMDIGVVWCLLFVGWCLRVFVVVWRRLCAAFIARISFLFF